MKYARYSQVVFFYSPILLTAIFMGGWYVPAYFAIVIASHLLNDFLRPPDSSLPFEDRRQGWLTVVLNGHVVVSALTLGMMLWALTPGDLLGLGAVVYELTGIESLRSGKDVLLSDALWLALTAGFVQSLNIVVAHELCHRSGDRVSAFSSRALLAFVGDMQFVVSHIYGHHVNVGTEADPATARRGESLYRFFVRSSVGQYREAMQFERARLAKKGVAEFGLQNQVVAGAVCAVVIAAVFAVLAGWPGLLAFLGQCVIAKFLFEAVNYIEHYGLVRVPGARVEKRHSWDCDAHGSASYLYNLNRHADHHMRPQEPFWKLQHSNDVLKLQFGYLSHIAIATIPPLWHRVTAPLLLHWDAHLANEAEAKLAAAANRNSRVEQLRVAASH